MAMQTGFDLIRTTFTDTTIFGIGWIITLIATVIAMALISGKNWSDWKTLLLPVTIALHVIGLVPSILQYVVGAILFVMETMSLQVLGNIAETTTNMISSTVDAVQTYKTGRTKKERQHIESFTEGLREKATENRLSNNSTTTSTRISESIR